MSLTVGVDTYATVAEADQYALDYGWTSAEWDDLSDAAKEVALRKGAQYLEIALTWKTARIGSVSQLFWNTSAPEKVKHAQIELAKRSVTEELLPDTTPTSKVRREKVEGAIDITYGDTGASNNWPIINKLLLEHAYSENNIIRLVMG